MPATDIFNLNDIMNQPICFRVIGIGHDTSEIIDRVNSYGYDYVSATVIPYPQTCLPTDEDKMVIIVAKDCRSHANSIAKRFHDAGILTIGLLDDADPECFDCVATGTVSTDYAELINEILKPVVTHGIIDYGFNDLHDALSGMKHFFIKSVSGHGDNRVADAVGEINSALTPSVLASIEHISIFLYLNTRSTLPLAMKELEPITGLLQEFPENIEVYWGTYHDDTVNDHDIKITILASGKKLIHG